MPPPAKVRGASVSKAMETLKLLQAGESFLVRDVEDAVRATKSMRDYNARERRKGTKIAFASRRMKQGLRIWRTS